MKLTTAQLDYIDRFLEQHQLDFLDFKIEVKDHLATATEAIMEEDKLAFEDAFLLSTASWQPELQVKKSWIISNERLFPEFVIQRIKRKVFFHYGVVLFLVLSIIAFSYVEFISYSFLKYAVISCGLAYFLMKRILMTDKTKTSYRFHFDYFNIPVTLFIIVLIFSDLFVKIPSIYLNSIGLIVIVDLPFAIYYFVKHRDFIKKINSI